MGINKTKTDKISISQTTNIIEALTKMDVLGVRLLLVMDNDTFISLISIGDLQRAIIKNLPLTTQVNNFFRENIQVCKAEDNYSDIKKEMLINRTECMPILDKHNKLIDAIFWEDLFADTRRDGQELELPVVIMAGGEGKRMRPMTNIIPKLLIPLDNKTIAEHIIDNFKKAGCKDFHFSINYKSNMIIDYFNKLEKDYSLEFFKEEKPLGTAGSLHLLHGKIKSTFFISNCDILIEDDYIEIYKYHKEYENELTIVGSFRHYNIPYGTLETGVDGTLLDIQEKPQISFQINSGMYILEPHLLNEIPKNQFFHITDLIESIKMRKGKVGVFPVSEKSWKDIGEWDKYLDIINIYRKNEE